MVGVATQDGVDAGEAARRTGDVVGGGGETVDDFVPGSRARNEDLYEDSGEVHVSKGLSPGLESEWGTKEPKEEREDYWICVVDNAVWEPRNDVEDGVGETGEDVGNVGTIEDGLEGGQEDDVDSGAKIRGYKTIRVECEEPCKDGGRWNEKLGGKWDEKGDNVEERNEKLGGEGGHLHDGEPEYGEDYVQNVDGIRLCEWVCLETCNRVDGRKGLVETTDRG